MKGDILIIDDNHRKAAGQVVPLIIDDIKKSGKKFVITVAGESGAGKSEVAASIAELLKDHGFDTFIFAQDDYFIYPPKTNENKRREDISWVGMKEVKLDLLDDNLRDAFMDKNPIVKPMVDFKENVITEETVDLEKYNILIAEGTYTTTLQNTDCRIFIDRNKMDTIESRKKRNREAQDEFLDNVLTIEHDIISKHKALADIIISKNWEASLAGKK
jgi:uridine kinase